MLPSQPTSRRFGCQVSSQKINLKWTRRPVADGGYDLLQRRCSTSEAAGFAEVGGARASARPLPGRSAEDLQMGRRS
jgi:hypothetical protein